jgi:hypothetical protein
MPQFKSYYSRILFEKSLISVTEFHLHLFKCLNVIVTYVFLPTSHCRRTYTALIANYTFYKETYKKQWKGYQMKVLGTYRLQCVIKTVTYFNRYLQYVCISSIYVYIFNMCVYLNTCKVSTVIWCYAVPDPTSRPHRGISSSLLHSP